MQVGFVKIIEHYYHTTRNLERNWERNVHISKGKIFSKIVNIPRDFWNGFLFLNILGSRKPPESTLHDWKEAMGKAVEQIEGVSSLRSVQSIRGLICVG